MKKKILTTGIIGFTILAFVGCNQQNTPNTNVTTNPNAPAVTPPATIVETKPATKAVKDASMIGVGKISLVDTAEVFMKDGALKVFDKDIAMSNGTKVLKDGTIVFADGKNINTTPNPNKEITAPNEYSTLNKLGDHTLVLSDGTILWNTDKASGVSLPDGSFFDWTAGATLHDGTSFVVGGYVLLPDGTEILDSGAVRDASGESLYTDDTKSKNLYINEAAGGKYTFKDGTVGTSDGKTTQITRPDGTIIVIGKSIKFSDGTLYSYADRGDSTITQGDGTMINLTESTVKFADGTTININGSDKLTTKDGKEVDLFTTVAIPSADSSSAGTSTEVTSQ